MMPQTNKPMDIKLRLIRGSDRTNVPSKNIFTYIWVVQCTVQKFVPLDRSNFMKLFRPIGRIALDSLDRFNITKLVCPIGLNPKVCWSVV